MLLSENQDCCVVKLFWFSINLDCLDEMQDQGNFLVRNKGFVYWNAALCMLSELHYCH